MDYAQARYYSSTLGRFFTIDPDNADAEFEVPQSWNAYIYARNNPMTYGDPTGESVTVCGPGAGDDKCRKYSNPEWAALRKHCEATGQCYMVQDKATRGKLYFLDPETFTFYLAGDFRSESDETPLGDLLNVTMDRDALNAEAGGWGGFRGIGHLVRGWWRSRDGGDSANNQRNRGNSAANTAPTPRPKSTPVFATNSAAAKKAKELGFTKVRGVRSNGQAVFKKGNMYITRDVDGHNGGAWKAADSVENLGRRDTRMGTYNEDLTVKVGQ